LIASLAPDNAHVFGHVGRERTLVRHDLFANAAGRLAKVNVGVISAASSRAERLLAQAANESPVTLVYPSGRPSLDGLGERIACKFQVAF